MMQNNNGNNYWEQVSNLDYWQEPAKEVGILMITLDKTRVKDVLDLGCGIGRHTLLLAGEGFNVTAAASSEQALSVLRKPLK